MWTDLPVHQLKKSSGTSLVTASIRELKSGQCTLILFLSSFIMKDLGNPETVNVQMGSGNFAGYVRITKGDTHKIVTAVRGGSRINLPVFEGIPAKKCAGEPCRINNNTGDELILQLPLAEWQKASAQIERAKERITTPPSKTIPDQRAQTIPDHQRKTDICDYLKNKGHKIARLANGTRFMLDGMTISAPDALAKINEYRRENDLAPFKAADVF